MAQQGRGEGLGDTWAGKTSEYRRIGRGWGGCGSNTRTVTPDSLDQPLFMELGQMKIRCEGNSSLLYFEQSGLSPAEVSAMNMNL